MKISLNEEVIGYNNQPIKNPDDSSLTYKELLLTVLTAQDPKGEETPEEKRQCFRLASVISSTEQPDITTKEAAFIITRAEKYASALGLGRLEELFDKPN